MQRPRLRRFLIGLGCTVGVARPAQAQETGQAVSVDSAAVLRESLDRPPARPSTDAVDVVEFPFKVVLYPARLVFRSVAGLAGLTTLPDPPLPVRVVREMRSSGLTPRIRSIGPRSGPALDLTLDHFNPMFLQTGISLVGSQRHRLGLIFGDSIREANLLVATTFRRDAQEDFWGLGPDTPATNRSDFEHETWEGLVRAGVRLGPFLSRVGLAVESNRVRRGRDGGLPDLQDVFAGDLPFGVGERTNFLRLDLSSTLYLTRRIGFQDRGVRLRGSAQIFRGIDGTGSDFHRFDGELLGYVPASLSQTLAFRGIIESNDLDNGPDVPLFHQLRLGGSRNGPRGFSGGRFRDRAGIAAMAEWRYEIWRDIGGRNRAEAFLLLDEGVVGSSISALGDSDLRSSYGFGFRLVKRRGVSLLTYLAFGGEGTQWATKTQWSF